MYRIVFAAFLACTSPVLASTPIIDQGWSGNFNFGFSTVRRPSGFTTERAQQFTVGLSGTLARIDLALWRGSVFLAGVPVATFDSNAIVTLYRGLAEAPGAWQTLATRTVPVPLGDAAAFPAPGVDPFSVTLDLTSEAIVVSSGESLFVSYRPEQTMAAGLGGNGINGLGRGDNPYLRGSLFSRTIDWPGGPIGGPFPQFDLLFRTYVTPSTGAIPEPSSWAMLIAGFGLTGAAMRRRRVAKPSSRPSASLQPSSAGSVRWS